jgi:sensor histidine kinase YesM
MDIFIFTDIDGVLNTNYKDEWNKPSIELYNRLCIEYNLKPVITSMWRISHTITELQEVFNKYGIVKPIYDYTPVFAGEGRGAEIEDWLRNNSYDGFIILDDNVRDIEEFGLPNIIKCRSWVGFSQEDYDKARGILLKLMDKINDNERK